MIDRSTTQTWQVLVIDDEPDSLEIVSRILVFHGAIVHAVSSGAAALQALDNITPTLIIMDLSMPGIDGWEMLYLFKKNPRLAEAPIVALTAHAMKGDRERALGAGFHYYLTKPLSPISFFDDLLALFANGNGHKSSSNQRSMASQGQD